jgi:quercetin dioxygenase-like cupin family protein
MSDELDYLSDDDAARLAATFAECRPAPERERALKARILDEIREVRAGSDAKIITVREAERRWEQRPFGLEVCTLHEDADSRAVLVRMAPGAVLASHHHEFDEENLILEGDALIGKDTYLTAGDYQFVSAGERHPIISSPNGCIVFVRGARKMPMRVTPGLLSKLIGFLWRNRTARDRRTHDG